MLDLLLLLGLTALLAVFITLAAYACFLGGHYLNRLLVWFVWDASSPLEERERQRGN